MFIKIGIVWSSPSSMTGAGLIKLMGTNLQEILNEKESDYDL